MVAVLAAVVGGPRGRRARDAGRLVRIGPARIGPVTGQVPVRRAWTERRPARRRVVVGLDCDDGPIFGHRSVRRTGCRHVEPAVASTRAHFDQKEKNTATNPPRRLR